MAKWWAQLLGVDAAHQALVTFGQWVYSGFQACRTKTTPRPVFVGVTPTPNA